VVEFQRHDGKKLKVSSAHVGLCFFTTLILLNFPILVEATPRHFTFVKDNDIEGSNLLISSNSTENSMNCTGGSMLETGNEINWRKVTSNKRLEELVRNFYELHPQKENLVDWLRCNGLKAEIRDIFGNYPSTYPVSIFSGLQLDSEIGAKAFANGWFRLERALAYTVSIAVNFDDDRQITEILISFIRT